MKYLNKFQIAEMLSCTPSAAVKLMKSWKVPVYYLGPGRGLGYRWAEEDVEQVISTRKIYNTEPPKKKKKSDAKSFFDQPIKDIIKQVKKG